MKLESRLIALDNGESVSSVWARPETPWKGKACAAIFGHGAGADMNHEFMKFFHEGVSREGFLGVRFNFPYKEKGRRAPDPPTRLEGAYRGVIAAVRREAAPERVFIGGKSMGGRIASMIAADGEKADGLFLLGYPLHPPRQPAKIRKEHLKNISCPMLFLQGSRDALCQLDLLKASLSALKVPVQLHVIEEGDHSFKPPKRSGRTELETRREALETLNEWLKKLS